MFTLGTPSDSILQPVITSYVFELLLVIGLLKIHSIFKIHTQIQGSLQISDIMFFVCSLYSRSLQYVICISVIWTCCLVVTLQSYVLPFLSRLGLRKLGIFKLLIASLASSNPNRNKDVSIHESLNYRLDSQNSDAN